MTFAQWLHQQRTREDSVGAISRYLEALPSAEWLSTYGAYLSKLKETCHNEHSEISFEDLKAAYREYQNYCDQSLCILHECWPAACRLLDETLP